MIASLSISSSLSLWAGTLPDTDVSDLEFHSIPIESSSPQAGALPNTDVSDFVNLLSSAFLINVNEATLQYSIPTESESSSRPVRERHSDHKHTPSRPSPLGRLPVITPTTIFFESGTLPRLAHTMLVDCDSTSISSNSTLEAVARPTAAAQIGLGHPRRASSVSSSSAAPSSSLRSWIPSSTIRSSKSA